MSETDGVDEAMQGWAGGFRLAMTVASQLAQRMARQRQEEMRELTAAKQARTAELEGRAAAHNDPRLEMLRESASAELQEARPEVGDIDARFTATVDAHLERWDTARDRLARINDYGWWDRAQPVDVAGVYADAAEWAAVDHDARRALDRINQESLARYGVDVEELEVQQRAGEGLGVAEAALLAGAAERSEPEALDTDPRAAAQYDSAERREQFAAAMENEGVPPESVARRIRADRSQAEPASAAVAAGNVRIQTHARKGASLDYAQLLQRRDLSR